MKKYLTGIAAVILAISASAFTKSTELKKNGEYYRNEDGKIVLIPNPPGNCIEASEFYCRYHLTETGVDNGEPENYEGEGPLGQKWVP